MGRETPPGDAGAFEPETRFAVAADVLWRQVAGAILVRTVDDPEIVELSGTGLLLWLALQAPVTAKELASDLVAAVGAPADVVAADLHVALGDLVRRRLVTPDGAM